MKKMLIGALAILAALFLGPRVVDWNDLKPVLASRVGNALGRRVDFAGPLSVSLLPWPSLSAADVTLANPDANPGPGGSSPMAILPKVEMRLALLPLLGGRVELASVLLRSPDIRLQTLADGRENWRFTGASRPPQGPVEPQSAPAGHGFGVDHLIIEDGRLSFRRPKGAPLTVDGVTGDLLLESPEGGWRARGTAMADGRAVMFSLLLGGGAAAPLDLTLGIAGEPGDLRINGQLATLGEGRRFTGKISARAPDLKVVVPGLPPGPLAVQGRITADSGSVDLQDLTLALGGAEARGSAHANFADRLAVDVGLSLSRLDLDSWLRAAQSAPSRGGLAGLPGPASPGPPQAGTPAMPPARRLPDWLSLSVDVNADVVDWRGGRLSGVKINAALANGEITVEQVKARLPGQGDAALFGFVTDEGGQPVFDGSFEITADDLRGLLAWLQVDVTRVPSERLHAGRLAGRLKASPTELEVGEASLLLDGSRVDGAATVKLGERPAVGLSLSVDQLNVDAYRPRKVEAAMAAPTVAVPAAVAFATAAASGGPHWYEALDVNLKAQAGRLTVAGLTVDGVGVDASWLNGVLFLHDLSGANLSGGSFSLAGELRGLGGSGPTVHGLRYELRAHQPVALFRLLALPLVGERWKGLALAGVADGGLDRLTLSARGEAGGAIVSAVGSVADPAGRPSIDLAVEVSHSSLAELAAMLAPGTVVRLPAGGVALSAKLAGDAGSLRCDDLRLRAGPLTVAGNARLRLDGQPWIEAALHAGEVPLQAFLHGPSRPAAGKPAAGPLPVKVVVPDLAAPRPVVRTAALAEHWSSDMVDLSWLRTVAADITLDARAITWGDVRLDAASLSLGLADGTATVKALSGDLWHGRLAAKGKVAADGAIGIDGEFHDVDLANALLEAAGLQIAHGTGNLQLHLASTGLSLAEWIGRLSGTGRMSVTDGSIKGFDLKAADQRLGSLANGGGLLALLQSGLTGGDTRIRQLSADLVAKHGILSFDDLAIEADGGKAHGTIQVNLPAYVMDAHADFRLDSAPGAPPLVLRVFGPLDAPRRILDINQMESWLLTQGLAKGHGVKDLLKSLRLPKAPANP